MLMQIGINRVSVQIGSAPKIYPFKIYSDHFVRYSRPIQDTRDVLTVKNIVALVVTIDDSQSMVRDRRIVTRLTYSVHSLNAAIGGGVAIST